MPFTNAATNLPPKTILFATDFSPASGAALRYAAALAAAYQSTLVVAHAIPEPQEAVTQHRISDRDEQFKADAERKMDLLKDFELLTRVRHREVVVEGRPEEALAYLADSEHADLLVLGTHGRTGVADLLLGSVAEAIFRKAKCPVITVGPRVRFLHEDMTRTERVLYATDLAGTQHALPYAVFITREHKAKLMVLHVMEGTSVLPYDVPDRWAEETKQQMRALFATGSGLEAEPEILVEMGRPAREILATALVHNADLIVMGLHPSKHSGSHTPWAVAHHVVSRAPCPVLTVRS